jgi:hypothetical protein
MYSSSLACVALKLKLKLKLKLELRDEILTKYCLGNRHVFEQIWTEVDILARSVLE